MCLYCIRVFRSYINYSCNFQGIFSSIISGNKAKAVPDPLETEDVRQSYKHLEMIFSSLNFPAETEDTKYSKAKDELDIGMYVIYVLLIHS